MRGQFNIMRKLNDYVRKQSSISLKEKDVMGVVKILEDNHIRSKIRIESDEIVGERIWILSFRASRAELDSIVYDIKHGSFGRICVFSSEFDWQNMVYGSDWFFDM